MLLARHLLPFERIVFVLHVTGQLFWVWISLAGILLSAWSVLTEAPSFWRTGSWFLTSSSKIRPVLGGCLSCKWSVNLSVVSFLDVWIIVFNKQEVFWLCLICVLVCEFKANQAT